MALLKMWNPTTMQWEPVQGSQGPQGEVGPAGSDGSPGAPGSVWYSGTGAPAAGFAVVNDWYLDDSNGDVYEKTAADTWTLRDNLTGPQGPQGIQGDTGLTGPEGPEGPQGLKGDTGDTGPQGIQGPQGDPGADGADSTVPGPTGPQGEQGIQGIQGPAGNDGADSTVPGPEGPQGDTGATGPQGDPGADGATWISGAGAPSDANGSSGDYYLDSTTDQWYEKVGASWVLRGDFTGATGSQGPQGDEGPQGPQGIQGPQGNDGADSTVPGPEGPKGDKGDTGDTGAQGPQGDPGADGADGADGSVWHAQSLPPTPGVDSKDGDFWLDTDNGAVSEQQAGAWVWVDNITGPQGPQGDPGNDGADGAQGPQGVPGEDGADGAQGPQGIQGVPGNDGADGATGPKGDKGDKGDTGATGPAGSDGADGATGPQGPEGPQGPQGEHGALTLQTDEDSVTGLRWVKIASGSVSSSSQGSVGECDIHQTDRNLNSKGWFGRLRWNVWGTTTVHTVKFWVQGEGWGSTTDLSLEAVLIVSGNVTTDPVTYEVYLRIDDHWEGYNVVPIVTGSASKDRPQEYPTWYEHQVPVATLPAHDEQFVPEVVSGIPGWTAVAPDYDLVPDTTRHAGSLGRVRLTNQGDDNKTSPNNWGQAGAANAGDDDVASAGHQHGMPVNPLPQHLIDYDHSELQPVVRQSWRRGADYNHPNNSNTIYPYDTPLASFGDVASYWYLDPGVDGRIQIVKAGYYRMRAGIRFNCANGTGRSYMALRHVGGEDLVGAQSFRHSAGIAGVYAASEIFHADVGDFCQANYLQNSGGNMQTYGEASTFIGLELVEADPAAAVILNTDDELNSYIRAENENVVGEGTAAVLQYEGTN